MPSDREIYQAATTLIREYGNDAAVQAAMHADAMLAAGDLDGLAAWKRIIRAVDTLLQKRPDGTTH